MTKKNSIGNLHENAKPCYVTLQPSKDEPKRTQKKNSNEMNRNKPILHTGIHENKAAAVEVKQVKSIREKKWEKKKTW